MKGLLRMRRAMRAKGQLGQAAVETALALPLFVFVLLGTLQLALMHQARLMAKYAAYKAARAGAITSVDMTRMERAALAVLVPIIKANTAVFKASDRTEYLQSLPLVLPNIMPDCGLKYVEITVCTPNKSLLGGAGGEVDFDSETAAGTELGRKSKGDMTEQGWKDFDRGRLAIQLTFNYRMPIPFADMMLYYIAIGQESTGVLTTFRLGKTDSVLAAKRAAQAAKYSIAAAAGQYVLPIRTGYVMRMQSNLFPNASGHELPQENKCVTPFARKGAGNAGGGANPDDDEDTQPGDP
jgi:TadE-like protein